MENLSHIIVTVNENEINIPIKQQKIAKQDEEQFQPYVVYQKHTLNIEQDGVKIK
jgi:hypothetical protein